MGEDIAVASPISYSGQFRKAFPFYLAIGMSESQFWDADCLLVKYYREAYTLKQEMQNQQAWLNGLYVYEAVSTTLTAAFSRKKSDNTKYPQKPHDFEPKKETNKEETQYKQQKSKFELMVAALNSKFKSKGGDES